VALARALVNHPSVLLLDEPLGALDLKLRKQMQTELTKLQRRVGITFIYVTHDQEEALTMSDRIAVMNHGRLLQVGTPAEIYENPAERFVMEFMGSPNVMAGTVIRTQGDTAEISIEGAGAVRGRTLSHHEPNSTVSILVRPERVRMSATRPSDGAGSLQATITRISMVGFVAHYFLRLDNGHELLAYRLNDAGDPASQAFSVGAKIHASWEEVNGRVFEADSGT
jgi:spermidine/putrescine transport system ATP-binding protein